MTKKDYKYLMDKREYILEHMKKQKNCGNCKYVNANCDNLFRVEKVKRIFSNSSDYLIINKINVEYHTVILRFYKIHDIKQKLNDQTTN